MLGGLLVFRAGVVGREAAVVPGVGSGSGSGEGSGAGSGATAEGGGAALGEAGGLVPVGSVEGTEGSWTAAGCSNTVSTSTACTPSQDNATAAPVAVVQAPS
ncbi:hypothetical protein GCM10009759_16430 [Kitasatospora saccharophila]|uniref:Uncharacterized protein n=1 Tax=Kitasatospora saccharophila TaxID=407973 RepID=A0ABN2WGX6_9ACTN